MRLHPLRSLEPVDALLAKTTVPYHQKILRNFREHMLGEILGDLDRIMATMSPHPVYHGYDQFDEAARTHADFVTVEGIDAVRKLYEWFIGSGRHVHQLDTQRLVVSDWGLVGDGFLMMPEPGADLIAQGLTGFDEDATYVNVCRFAYFIPYEDGLVAGEDIYRPPSNMRYEKIEPHEVVDLAALRAQVAAGEGRP